jgi:hypothetical protein
MCLNTSIVYHLQFFVGDMDSKHDVAEDVCLKALQFWTIQSGLRSVESMEASDQGKRIPKAIVHYSHEEFETKKPNTRSNSKAQSNESYYVFIITIIYAVTVRYHKSFCYRYK